MKKTKVSIVMSTYNGERYLKEQIESILTQKHIEPRLIVRDDGSTDGTKKILEDYASQGLMTVFWGKNVGWRKSFMKLLNNLVPEEENCYAFADQDDIWDELKLISAVSKINNAIPMVYHSNVTIMDDLGRLSGNRFGEDQLLTTEMPKAFLNGYGVGATMVFNNRMLKLIQKSKVNIATNHDAYVMALGNLFGKVIYDKKSYILYRRHEGTATGFVNNNRIAKPTLMMRYERYKRNPKNMFSNRARLILDGYNDMLSDIDKKNLSIIANYRKNIWYKLELLFSINFVASGIRKTLQVKYRTLVNTL